MARVVGALTTKTRKGEYGGVRAEGGTGGGGSRVYIIGPGWLRNRLLAGENYTAVVGKVDKPIRCAYIPVASFKPKTDSGLIHEHILVGREVGQSQGSWRLCFTWF